MRFSSFDHSTPDAPFEAVDALFTLRAEIARLREREAALCDEILTFATEQGRDKVLGAGRMAVVETRRPLRIAPEHLPREVLANPEVFRACEETVVLLAPRAGVTSSSDVAPIVEPVLDADVLEQDMVSDSGSDFGPDMASDEATMDQEVSEVPDQSVLEEPVVEEVSSEDAAEDAEAAPLQDISETASTELASAPEEMILDLADTVEAVEAPTQIIEDMSEVTEKPVMRTIGAPVLEIPVLEDLIEESPVEELAALPSDDESPLDIAFDDIEPLEELAAEADAETNEHTVSDPFVQADDPFDLKAAGPRMASPEYPLVDLGDAPEGETPRDLRPTSHADLQPLAGLQDEVMAHMLADADAPVEPATLPDALDLARALEAEADQSFEQSQPDTPFDLPATAFSSRRIAVGGEG